MAEVDITEHSSDIAHFSGLEYIHWQDQKREDEIILYSNDKKKMRQCCA